MCDTMESYFLDTSVVSLILNSEMRERSPSTIMGFRPGLYAAWRLADEKLEEIPRKSADLRGCFQS